MNYPSAERASVNCLRSLTSKDLRELEKPLLVCDKDHNPLVYLIPYETYMKTQDQLAHALNLLLQAPGDSTGCRNTLHKLLRTSS